MNLPVLQIQRWHIPPPTDWLSLRNIESIRSRFHIQPASESIAKEEVQTEDTRITAERPADNALYRNSSISGRQLARMLKVSVDTVVSRRRAMGVNFRERRKGTTSYYYCARSKRPCPKAAYHRRSPSGLAYRLRQCTESGASRYLCWRFTSEINLARRRKCRRPR